MTDNYNNILNGYSSIHLEETDSVKLLNRTDTKFLFNTKKLYSILEKAKTNYRLLSVNNKHTHKYKTLYFDTDDLIMYKAHLNGKKNRFKIRQREYMSSGITFFEIKLKTNKDKTIKKRFRQENIQESLSTESKQFIEKHTNLNHNSLNPVLYNKFSRITLVNKYLNERITIDFNLSYSYKEKNYDIPWFGIAEVKQEGYSTTDFVKILKEKKIYQSGMSKYCTGILLLNKNIKYNRFKERLLLINKITNNEHFTGYTKH